MGVSRHRPLSVHLIELKCLRWKYMYRECLLSQHVIRIVWVGIMVITDSVGIGTL